MEDDRQQELPFWLGGAQSCDEAAMLFRALKLVDADIYLSRLVERIFECRGGLEAWIAVSRAEMGRDPRWLNGVSRTKITETIAVAQRMGLILARRDPANRAAPNSYAIDWDGVRKILGVRGGDQVETRAATRPTRAATRPTRAATRPGPPNSGNDGGERGRALACAPSHTEEFIPSSSPSTICNANPAPIKPPIQPTATTTDFLSFRQKALDLCGLFWAGKAKRLRDRRDQRLIYRLVVLRMDAVHGDWIRRLVQETADARPENPLALLQAWMPEFAPAGIASDPLLRSIDVPRWALADPREWCPNGEEPQRE